VFSKQNTYNKAFKRTNNSWLSVRASLILAKLSLAAYWGVIFLSNKECHMATRYKDIDHDSGVTHFEIGGDHIRVWFSKAPKPYLYSYASAGQQHIESMKRLAELGDGLNAYINKHVKKLYVR
jgi:hypothetical protein